MKVLITAYAVIAAVFYAQAAEARLRECTQAETADVPQEGDPDFRNLQPLFTVPSITYNRPLAGPLGLSVPLLVASDGHIECVETYSWLFKALAMTPQRRAILKSMDTWRYAPFKGGKSNRVIAYVNVPETVDFKYHEDMPTGPLFSTVVRLDRSACFGTCPDYSIIVHGDGRVDYTGYKFTDVKGHHSYRISPGAVAALIERLRARDIWSMSGTWMAPVTDGPTYTTTLRVGKQRRILVDYEGKRIGIPQAVVDAENDIDATTGGNDLISLTPAGLEVLKSDGFVFASGEGADLLVNAISDDEVRDDTINALLDLKVPITGGHASNRFRSPEPMEEVQALDVAIFSHRNGIADRLLNSGALTLNGLTNQKWIDSAFQSAVSAGRLPMVETIWTYHPTLAYTELPNDGSPAVQTPVTMLLDIGATEDESWQGLDIAKFLLDRGVDVNGHNAEGATLLHIAARKGNVDFVRYLLARGALVNVLDKDHDGALNATFDEDVALVLLEAGADPAVQPDLHPNFFYYAQDYQWPRAVEWLKAHGYSAQLAANAPLSRQ